MAISTYTDLQTQLSKWLKGSDLSEQTDTLIGLVESNLNRQLRVPQMETVLSIFSTTGELALPDDFLQLKQIRVGTRPPLRYLNQNDFQLYLAGSTSNPSDYYTIIGSTVYVEPFETSNIDYVTTYWAKIPTLTVDNPTNWLMTANSDIYFFGALGFAEAFGWNDERIPLFRAAYDEAVDALIKSGIKARYGSGPLTPQAPVTDVTYRGDGYRRAGYVDSALLSDSGDILIDG